MLAIVGTVPDQKFPLTTGKVSLKDDEIYIQGKQVHVNRGTPALLAAAVKARQVMGKSELFGYLVGDIGLGDGSRKLYEYLTKNLGRFGFSAITFHYLQPDVDWHNRVLFAIEEMTKQPVLIADAGFMYAAKMSGQAAAYDLFTPDIGELAFLADENAPLACPAPVLQTKSAIEEVNPGLIKVIVDNEASKQNVCRFLESRNFETYIKEDGNDFLIIGKRKEGISPEVSTDKKARTDTKKIMVCGTCLTHFNLLDKKQVGETTNMLDIVTAIQLADKVINI